MNPFEALERHYPKTIQQMNNRFNAPQFILELAHQHQGLYIQALAQYADHDAPFQAVHRQLAQTLSKFKDLIAHDGQESSTDIFGHSNSASVWIKRG
ncbi:MAG: hypothetical protein ABI690_16925 [Chloroflexota bacterium]